MTFHNVLHTSFGVPRRSFHTKCKLRSATLPLHLPSLPLYVPSLPPPLLPSLHPSFHPGSDCGSRHTGADVSACLLWYSGLRFAWSPRSGTNNLFNPLIVIRDINKFGWKTAPWTLNLPSAEMYRFLSVSPRLLGYKKCVCLTLLVLVVSSQSGPQIH